MKDDLFSDAAYDDEYRSSGRDYLFIWTVGILLLTGLAVASWVASFHIFGHPEEPFSYEILQKLNKIDPPKQFELVAAPRGEFLPPQRLYERYSGLPDHEIDELNRVFVRNFIRNYRGVNERVPYVIGDFNILETYVLSESNMFQSGVVALAQSTDFPAVMIEHVYTAEPDSVPILQRILQTGLDIQLKRTVDLSSILHINRLDDGRIIFTLVPLQYGSYALSESVANVRLSPPTQLNLEAGWPVIDAVSRQAAEEKYLTYRRSAGLDDLIVRIPDGTAPVERDPSAPTIPVFASSTPPPTPGPAPEIRPAIPVLSPSRPVVAEATPAPTPPAPLLIPELAAATPPPTPAPAPESTPPPMIAAATPAESAVLQPFLQTTPAPTPAPAITAANSSWRTYQPGQMPRGRLLNTPDATRLADQGPPSETLYLQGSFTVTAARGNTAILRPRGGVLSGMGGREVRIIVEFPTSGGAPEEGASVSRASDRPFQITDVRKGSDGQLNIYVREITSP